MTSDRFDEDLDALQASCNARLRGGANLKPVLQDLFRRAQQHA